MERERQQGAGRVVASGRHLHPPIVAHGDGRCRCGPGLRSYLVVVQGVKPDYSGPNVTGVVPALLGVRPAEWLPEPVVGARTTVLLVLDGLGWAALERYPECAARAAGVRRRADHHRRAVDHPGRAHVDHDRAAAVAPRHHRVPVPRTTAACSTPSAGSSPTAAAPPDPEHVQRQPVFAGRAGPRRHQGDVPHHRVHRRAPARRPSSTAGRPRRRWSSTCGRLVAGGARFVYAYYPGVDEIAHAYGLEPPYYPAELARRRPAGGRAARRAARRRRAARHRRPRPGAHRARRLARASPRCTRWSRPTRATAGSATSTRGRAPPPTCSRRREQLHGGDAWVFRREQLLDEGWLGPDPVSATYRRVGDVVLAARDRRGVRRPDAARTRRS